MDNVIARCAAAGKTNKVEGSLVKCEVKLESGEWISPDSCKTFYINEDAQFPDITYEIKTNLPGPYEWSWHITWTGLACKQSTGHKRFKQDAGPLPAFVKRGSFKSDSKKWKADLGGVFGGTLTVKVKAGGTTFARTTFIRGKNPGKEKVQAYLDANWKDKHDLALIKKIFQQESHYRQFYSDEQPLVSHDNGYGIGQVTNPRPSYADAWNWKEHLKTVMNKFLPEKRGKALEYFEKIGCGTLYTQEQYDNETAAFYNGARRFYESWDAKTKTLQENTTLICDPNSNSSWKKADYPDETAKELLKENVKSKSAGYCYTKHIIAEQGGF